MDLLSDIRVLPLSLIWDTVQTIYTLWETGEEEMLSHMILQSVLLSISLLHWVYTDSRNKVMFMFIFPLPGHKAL